MLLFFTIQYLEIYSVLIIEEVHCNHSFNYSAFILEVSSVQDKKLITSIRFI